MFSSAELSFTECSATVAGFDDQDCLVCSNQPPVTVARQNRVLQGVSNVPKQFHIIDRCIRA